jgi:hypothetical protein
MKKTLPFILIFISLAWVSCDSDPIDANQDVELQDTLTEYSLAGYVQKGPYINGTSITINELQKDLTQTGKNYSAQIIDNKGSFELNNIQFASSYVELKANGFYFNEVLNQISSAQLTLYALSNIKDKTTLNVNVLSYLEKGRIQYLVSTGYNFIEAKSLAQQEVLAIFGFDATSTLSSEELNITAEGNENAQLLAASVILQGYLSIAELSELLANISTDIREDGVLDNETLGLQLINTAVKLNLDEIRNNIEARYETMGQQITVADFEKQVTHFIEKSEYEPTEKIEYPKTGTYGLNVLNEENTSFPKADYSMNAILPDEFTLKVEMIGSSFAYYAFQENSGWTQTNYDAYTQTTTFESNQSGEIDLKMASLIDEFNTTATFKIYENGASVPTRVKHINYNGGSELGFPENGNFGKNIFAMTDSTFLDTSDVYSLSAQLPDDIEYNIEIKMHFSQENSYSIDKSQNTNWVIYDSPLELRLELNGKNIDADLPIKFYGSDQIYIEGDVHIEGIHW